jgi:hypothetical protein
MENQRARPVKVSILYYSMQTFHNRQGPLTSDNFLHLPKGICTRVLTFRNSFVSKFYILAIFTILGSTFLFVCSLKFKVVRIEILHIGAHW